MAMNIRIDYKSCRQRPLLIIFAFLFLSFSYACARIAQNNMGKTVEAQKTEIIKLKEQIHENSSETGPTILTPITNAEIMPNPSSSITTTGFYWPTTPPVKVYYASFLADGCSTLTGNQNYFKGEYHVGTDIQAALDSNIHAISDGVVVYYSHNSDWGTDERDGQVNDGLVIKHYLIDHSAFYAVYGHIRSNLRVGDTVLAGNVIGKVGMWRYKDDRGDWIRGQDHLHFGIQPGNDFLNPKAWGIMKCPEKLPIDPKGYVDPIVFIETHTPGSLPLLVQITPTQLTFTETPVPSPEARFTDDGKVYLGDKLILDITPENLGCFGVGGIDYSPTHEYFLVIFQCIEGDDDAFLFRSDGSNQRRITGKGDYVNYGDAKWSPDGKSFVYERVNDFGVSPSELPESAPPDGLVRYDVKTGEKTLLVKHVHWVPFEWSPDERYIAYFSGNFIVDPQKKGVLYLITSDGSILWGIDSSQSAKDCANLKWKWEDFSKPMLLSCETIDGIQQQTYTISIIPNTPPTDTAVQVAH
jgi:hypothetical protein